MNEMKSKSQKKRDAAATQAFGITLVGLNQDVLSQLPLSPRLATAIHAAKSLKSHTAIRRQALWIGKLLRDEGEEEIQAAYEQLRARDSNQTAVFHAIEAWRTRLIAAEAEALTALMTAYPAIDGQTIRQLIKKAQEEQQRALHTGAGRALFRYLRSHIE
jgi:ribosome-associated protein